MAKKRETTPRDLGYSQTRNERGQFGRYGGQGDRNELYYYVYNGIAMEARKVTTQSGKRITESMAGSLINQAGKKAEDRYNY